MAWKEKIKINKIIGLLSLVLLISLLVTRFAPPAPEQGTETVVITEVVEKEGKMVTVDIEVARVFFFEPRNVPSEIITAWIVGDLNEPISSFPLGVERICGRFFLSGR